MIDDVLRSLDETPDVDDSRIGEMATDVEEDEADDGVLEDKDA
jgi:hypothetical protein